MHLYFYAESSVKKWGGQVEDYLPIHSWFDESKAHLADVRHRALRHHSEGIFLAEALFGNTITNSAGRVVPVRQIGERHVIEDLGRIPCAADWLRAINPSLGCFAGRKRWLLNWTPSRKKTKQNYVIDMTASTREHVIRPILVLARHRR